jgi:hypothetical protein
MMWLSVLLAASLPVTTKAEWPTYVNARYGYSICYPASVFKPEREAGNGDGRRFLSGQGAELRVFGLFNALDQTLEEFAVDQAHYYQGQRGRIIYRAAKPSWIVLSGDNGGTSEFYIKAVKWGDEFVTFQLRYPVSQARVFRPLVERLSRCMALSTPPD